MYEYFTFNRTIAINDFLTNLFLFMWQFSRSQVDDVQINGLLKYSGQSDNTATQEYTVRVMYNANNTPRYMQTACNHMQVGAKYDRSPPALVPDCRDSTPSSSNGGLSESS